MPRNTLGDLNNHLMGQLEKLADDDLKGEELKDEIARAKSMTSVAGKVIDNARLVLDAQRQAHRMGQLGVGDGWRPLLPGRQARRRIGPGGGPGGHG